MERSRSRIHDVCLRPGFRVKEERINGADPIAFTYDADGLLATAGALTIGRDPRNTTTALLTVGNASTRISSSVYGEADSVVTTVGSATVYRARYTVDALGRLSTKREDLGGTTALYTFAYDSIAQLTDVTRDGVTVEHYEYDGNGNRVRAVTAEGVATATIGAQDRLLAYGDATFAYGRNGEVTTLSIGADTTRYRYTAWSQLSEVALPDGTRVSYIYDGDGRRVGKEVNGALVRQWLYRGSSIVAELDGAGVLVSHFVYGDRLKAPEYLTRGGVTYRLVLDERGSVRQVVNATTGIPAQQLAYDAFGRVVADSNPGFQPFGFAGGLYDTHTKLTKFGLRDYDAVTGRWTTPDPLLFDGGDWNLYRYAGADPVNIVDSGGDAILAQMANDQEELEKLEAKAAENNLARRNTLRKRLCKNGASLLERYSKVRGMIDKFDAHHVMQDAAMKAVEGYLTSAGISIPLVGRFAGSPHSLATAAQNRLRGFIPDAWVATEALHFAGCDESDIERITKVLEEEYSGSNYDIMFR